MKFIIKKIDKYIFFGTLKFLFYKLKEYFFNLSFKKYHQYQISNSNFYYTILGGLADKYGTDKGFNNLNSRIFYNNWHPHNYTDFYSKIFDHNRQHIKKILECGIGSNNTNIPSNMGKDYKPGGSLRMWKEYFLNAEIYGADIDKDILFTEERIKTFYVDQLSTDSIKKMWGKIDKKNFDLIIDDGLHNFEAGTIFFNNSIEYLSENGIYIIEDVDPSYLHKLTLYFENDFYVEVVRLKSNKFNLLKDNNLILIKHKNYV
tara:strand:- start:138 stop:917 length:780 start_codon:yes stop_codon:yes gene_type:complete